jgi:esterase/lipase
LSFKDKEKMKLALSVPTKYGRKPRLATARELLDATKRISATVHEFDAPFLVLHGLEDHVTCPKVSEMLYNESPSKDKEIKLYKGMLDVVSVHSFMNDGNGNSPSTHRASFCISLHPKLQACITT